MKSEAISPFLFAEWWGRLRQAFCCWKFLALSGARSPEVAKGYAVRSRSGRVARPLSLLLSSFLALLVVAIAAPSPQLRRRNQTALNRVAMHVAQLLDFLPTVVHIEIIVPRLPKRPRQFPVPERHLLAGFAPPPAFPATTLFQHLPDNVTSCLSRLPHHNVE